MTRATPQLVSLAEFCAAPLGQMAASEHVLVWFPNARLRVFAFWSAPTVQDMIFAQRALAAALSETLPRHAALMDVRRVTTLHEAAFADYVNMLIEQRDTIAARVSRSVALVADNAVGERVRVLRSLVRLPYEAEVMSEPAAAMRWLGTDDLSETTFATLTQQIGTLASEGGLLRRGRESIRVQVAAGQRLPVLKNVAKGLGVSDRSLQRAFAAAGTSYREELRRAQLGRAMTLLSTSDMKLAGVALDVGFQKLQTLNQLFVADVGMTPAQWRAKHRTA